MSRLLILLCMIGWALYIVHTNSNRSVNLAAQHAKASQSPATQAVTLSIEPQLQPIASPAARSPHAITPDEMPRQAAANAPVAPPQTQVTESTKPPSDADQNLAS